MVGGDRVFKQRGWDNGDRPNDYGSKIRVSIIQMPLLLAIRETETIPM